MLLASAEHHLNQNLSLLIVFFLSLLSIIIVQANSLSSQNYQTGPLSPSQAPLFEFGEHQSLANEGSNQQGLRRPNNLLTGTVKHIRAQPTTTGQTTGATTTTAKPKLPVQENKRLESTESVLSTDCYAKRSEILAKQLVHQRLQNSLSASNRFTSNLNSNRLNNNDNKQLGATTSSYQRLKPRHHDIGQFNQSVETSGNQLDNSEHVPQCTLDGNYEPIQCHKIGYCWCVNKYGQAIKNSATLAGQKPYCPIDLYESESNGSLVVTGASERRIKNLLRPPTSSPDLAQPHHQHQATGAESDNDASDGERKPENDFEKRVSTSKEPSLALVPNECSLSRLKARERASNYSSDSIWIPRCDSEEPKLYADKQCHHMKVSTIVCWCVDQITGLPLRTGEQLGKQPANINCTDIKRLNEIVISNSFKSSSQHNQNQATESFSSQSNSANLATYTGFSTLCDTHKRIEFVLILIGQFRQQISEFMKFNPTFQPPDSMTSSNPNKLNESQIAEWKFSTLDTDSDGKLDNVEWFKFKNNFKLIDRPEEMQKFSLQRGMNARHSISPLVISRVQRRCWRDFLLYCGSGILSNDAPINLTNWLNCTELPSKSDLLPLLGGNPGKSTLSGQQSIDNVPDNIYEALKAAVRSKHKNPFLGILKPD